MKEIFANHFSKQGIDKADDYPEGASPFEGLNERQKCIAQAYIDVEIANIVQSGDKSLDEISKRYCTFGSIFLANSNIALRNHNNVSHIELYGFMQGITYEREDALHCIAKDRARELGFKPLVSVPKYDTLMVG